MEPDFDQIFRQFIERIDRSTLAAQAEQVLKDKAPQGGGMSVFTNYSGGLIGFTLRKLLLDSAATCCWPDLDKLAERLIEFYEFPADWVPPRLLVREALALTVHRRRIIERLQRELGQSVDLVPHLERAAVAIRRPEEAFLLDNELTDALLEELRQGK